MKIRTLILWFAIFLTSLTIAVSCTSSQPPTSTVSPTTPTASTSPIRLGFNTWPSSINLQVAQEEGILEANNVNVDLKYFDYLKSVQALNKGELDANIHTLSDTVSSIASENTLDQVIVLLTDVSYGGDAVIVRDGINTIADLKGKKIATEEGAVDHFMLLLGLKKAGLSPADIQLKNLDQRASVAAFVEGQVDATVLFIPYKYEALKRPGSKVLFDSKEFPTAIPSHLIVDRKLINERPQDIQAIVKTWFDTLEFVRKNPEKSYKIMANYLGVSLEEFKKYESEIKFFNIDENLKAFRPGSDSTSLPYAAEEFSQFLFENKVIKSKPNLSRLFDDRFIRAYAASLTQ